MNISGLTQQIKRPMETTVTEAPFAYTCCTPASRFTLHLFHSFFNHVRCRWGVGEGRVKLKRFASMERVEIPTTLYPASVPHVPAIQCQPVTHVHMNASASPAHISHLLSRLHVSWLEHTTRYFLSHYCNLWTRPNKSVYSGARMDFFKLPWELFLDRWGWSQWHLGALVGSLCHRCAAAVFVLMLWIHPQWSMSDTCL